MFGVNSAPESFQRVYAGLLAGCLNCINFLDDTLIYGKDEKEHDECLDKVHSVLRDNNVTLNEDKCVRKVQEVEWLGHKLSHRGINADERKVEAIKSFRAPTNKEELRSFLGLVTYLGKFIPDVGTLTDPLRKLTKEEETFRWTLESEKDFRKLQAALEKLPTLAFFDPNNLTRLIADASPVALGAVLLQFDKQNQPKVISYANKSLSDTERRYSQTEKESLALVWAVERFFYYLAGLEFELVTDHKPLETIFKPAAKAPARIERWLLRMQPFKFKVIYKSGNFTDSFSSRWVKLKHFIFFRKIKHCGPFVKVVSNKIRYDVRR